MMAERRCRRRCCRGPDTAAAAAAQRRRRQQRQQHQRQQQQRRRSGLMPPSPPPALLLLALLAAAALTVADARTVTVAAPGAAAPPGSAAATMTTLLAALRDPTVDRVVVAGGNYSTAGEFDAYSAAAPLEITRNVTVTGADGINTVLDLAFGSSQLELCGACVFEFSNITVSNERRGAGSPMDLFLGKPGSIVWLRDAVRLRVACASGGDSAAVVKATPLSTLLPNGDPRQEVDLKNVTFLGVDFKNQLHIVDYSTDTPRVVQEGRGPTGGYVVVAQRVLRLCRSTVPEACLSTHSPDACVNLAIDRALGRGSGFEGGEGGGGGRGALPPGALAAVVAVPVAAAAAAGAAGALLWRRRRRRRAAAGGGATGAASVKAPSTHGGGGRTGDDGDDDGDVEAPRDGDNDIARRRSSSVGAGGGTSGRSASGAAAAGPGDLLVKAPLGCGRGWSTASAVTSPLLGAIGDEPIHFGKLIGTGSFGRVFRARWAGRDVAVKVVEHDASASEVVENEVRLAMVVNHPNVVRCLHCVSYVKSRPSLSSATPATVATTPTAGAATDGGGGGGSRATTATTGGALGAAAAAAVAAAAAAAAAAAGDAAGGGLGGGSRTSSSCTTGTPAAASGGAGGGGVSAAAAASPLTSGGQQQQRRRPRTGGDASGLQQQQQQQQGDSGASSLLLGPGGLAGGATARAETWLVCELCDCGTLAGVAAEWDAEDEGDEQMVERLLLLRDCALGLKALHDRDIVHGDLNARNVLVSSSPAAQFGLVAKLADLGLSRTIKQHQTHHTTRTVGTMSHMPPELLRWGRMSPAADVYAFGVMMWELFTRQAAFRRLHYGQFFEVVVLQNLRPLVPDAMPSDYRLLMERCWAIDAADRPDAARVLECLRHMLESRQPGIGGGGGADGGDGADGGAGDGGAPGAPGAPAPASGDGASTARSDGQSPPPPLMMQQPQQQQQGQPEVQHQQQQRHQQQQQQHPPPHRSAESVPTTPRGSSAPRSWASAGSFVQHNQAGLGPADAQPTGPEPDEGGSGGGGSGGGGSGGGGRQQGFVV